MFEAAAGVLHVVEWSGLSIGALVALGALAWFVAPLRGFAIVGALIVGAGWAGTLHGDKVGRADVQAQWNAAKVAAAQADKENAAKAAADATTRENKILADANAQHQKDLKFISSLQSLPQCGFDPFDGGVFNGTAAVKSRFSIPKAAAVPGPAH